MRSNQDQGNHLVHDDAVDRAIRGELAREFLLAVVRRDLAGRALLDGATRKLLNIAHGGMIMQRRQFQFSFALLAVHKFNLCYEQLVHNFCEAK